MIDLMHYQILFTAPNVQEFVCLRDRVGWGDTCLAKAKAGLENSLFHVTVRDNHQLIGMGRVVGDGALFFYIQDLVVDPAFQNKKIGYAMMQEIETYLEKNAGKGATIGLLAAQGKESFYAQFGYTERTGTPLGRGMCKFV